MNPLPEGWFDDADVAVYRELYKRIPVGGETAELGTFFGRSICAVADIILERHLLVYCIDTFEGTSGDEAPFYEAFKSRDIYAEFVENIKRFGLLPENAVVIRSTTDAAVSKTPSDLDFVFIDADHTYDAVRKDIQNWLPKVKKGGVLAGDDYTFGSVKQAVEELIPTFEVKASIWVTNV